MTRKTTTRTKDGETRGARVPKIDPRWKMPPENDEGKPEPWTCGTCGLVREAYWNVWDGDWHLDTGPCQRCIANEFAEESLRRARHNVLVKYGLENGVYAGMSFDTYTPDPKYPKQAIAKQVAMEVVEDWKAGKWERGMILAGTAVGVGKTHLAVATAREGVQIYRPEMGERILAVWGMPDLLTEIKNSYNNGGPEHLLRSVTESGIVILDDIGVEHIKQETWFQEIAYNIFNSRWVDQRATIVTTNLRSHELRQHVGERTYSRMLSLVGAPIHITGDDYRKKKHEG